MTKTVEQGEIYITQTDKSWKLAVIQMEEYVKMGEVHTKNDKVITEDELYKKQIELNKHALSWLNIFQVGETHGEKNVSRIQSAFTSRACATLGRCIIHESVFFLGPPCFLWTFYATDDTPKVS